MFQIWCDEKKHHLPVFLSAIHEIQDFVHLCLHLIDVGHGVDGPSIIRGQGETLEQERRIHTHTQKITAVLTLNNLL